MAVSSPFYARLYQPIPVETTMQCKFFTILDTRTAILSKGSVSLRLCVVPTSVFTYRRAAYSITKPEGKERVGCDGETVSSAQKERERERDGGGCAKGSFVLPDETSQNDVMG